MVREYYRKSVRGIREQRVWLRAFPGVECSIRGGALTAIGWIQPTPLSERYKFRLDYTEGKAPRVRVSILEPPLKRRDKAERIPHTYDGDRPCPFYPGVDWTADQWIAFTVIPWLAIWLFFYECWLATGEWYGGGEHPPGPKDDSDIEGEHTTATESGN